MKIAEHYKERERERKKRKVRKPLGGENEERGCKPKMDLHGPQRGRHAREQT